jgi:hypothetical protein
MKSRFAILSIVVSSILCSCDESSDTHSYPSTFSKTHVTFIGGYRIFSSKGEIKNQTIINRHIEHDTVQFHYAAKDLMHKGKLDTVFFNSPEHAIINFQYRNIPCDVTKQSPIGFILMRQDTTSGYTAINELSHHVLYFLGEAKPDIVSETLYSSIRGYYQFRYRARQPVVLLLYGNEVTVPVVMYRWSYHNDSYSETLSGQTYNRLNEDFYQELNESDTVSVMQAYIHMKKI